MCYELNWTVMKNRFVISLDQSDSITQRLWIHGWSLDGWSMGGLLLNRTWCFLFDLTTRNYTLKLKLWHNNECLITFIWTVASWDITGSSFFSKKCSKRIRIEPATHCSSVRRWTLSGRRPFRADHYRQYTQYYRSINIGNITGVCR